MNEFEMIGGMQFAAIITGLLIFTLGPVAIAIIWKIRSKDKFSTILLGACTFLVFALILEKPIQNLIISPNHALGAFIASKPLLWAFIVGLFPGIFEETGRFVVFKTVLKNRTNKETGISHGIGHGCFEVILLLGLTFFNNIIYAVMINTGTFGAVVDQVKAVAPEQVDQLKVVADQLAAYSFGSLAIAVAERMFSVLFHVGASMLVFYACRDKEKFWLYPLAVALHTAMDFVAGLYVAGVFVIPPIALEAVVAVFGIGTFASAYFFIYRKDAKAEENEAAELPEFKRIFDSARIDFVEVSENLVNDYLTMVNDEEHVGRLIGIKGPVTLEKELEFVRGKLSENAPIFSMIEKSTGEFIGNIEFMDMHDNEAELGIAITAAKQDKGYGSEAIPVMISYGKEKLGLSRITLKVYPDNARAIHVYESCGFKEYDRNETDIFMEI